MWGLFDSHTHTKISVHMSSLPFSTLFLRVFKMIGRTWTPRLIRNVSLQCLFCTSVFCLCTVLSFALLRSKRNVISFSPCTAPSVHGRKWTLNLECTNYWSMETEVFMRYDWLEWFCQTWSKVKFLIRASLQPEEKSGLCLWSAHIIW